MTDRPDLTPRQDASLTLLTLGRVGLYAPGRPEPVLGPGKPLALLVYLALTPGRRTSRESLMDLLWGDLDPDRARRALRQALFHVRRCLGEDALTATEELALTSPVDTDRDQFLRAIEGGNLERALDWYGGEFLPAFGVPGGAAFEQWADLERNRLRAAFLRSGELLVRRLLNQSRFREAQRLARRVRDEGPAAEVAWRLLLETVVAGRDFVAAAVEAEAVEQWAAREGIVLEPATRLAISQARLVTPPTIEPSGDESLMFELTGREREFAAIVAAWDAVRAGPARHLHLTAPAGLGKTRLLHDAVARLRAGGASVIVLRATPGDREIPYAFAADLAMAIAELPGATGIAPAAADALIGLNPALSSRLAGRPDTSAGEEALRRRIHALADLVHSVADDRPFVMVMDDLHWVDRLSSQALEGLFERLHGAHVLCLTAARPEFRPPRTDATVPLPLAPLTPPQVAGLMLALAGLPEAVGWADAISDGLHRATRGSPLLILQTLRLAMDEGILEVGDGRWICHDELRLASLLKAGEALRQRIRSLPEAQRKVLALLAIAGIPLAGDSLAATAGVNPTEVGRLLDALERQGMAGRNDQSWFPAHDEIGEAAREALAPDERVRADRAIGMMWVDRHGGDAHRLLRGLRHLIAAGDERQVADGFRRYVRILRGQRDRRPFRDIAADVLGPDAAPGALTTLSTTPPLAWRLGLWNPARQAAAITALLLAAGAVAASSTIRARRDEGLPRLVLVDTAGSFWRLNLRPGDFDGRQARLIPGRAGTGPATLARLERPPVRSPDGRTVAWTQDSGDSTTLDIWLRTPAGARRLTREFRDDIVAGWLPDGTALVGLTSRWSPIGDGDYDVAIFDTATGGARQVTRGREHDQLPYSSPDGTRIAFARESDEEAPHLCVVARDGRDQPECRLPGGLPVLEVFGWLSPTELLVTLDSAGTRPLVRYDWLRNERRLLAGPYFTRGQLSPDRRWIVGAAQLAGIHDLRTWVIPVDRPAQGREVEEYGGSDWASRWWEGRANPADVIARIEFTDTVRTILPGMGTRLGIRAFTASGAESPVLAAVRWASSDTLIATVDSSGSVRPRTTGKVTISASLVGWRTTSTRFTVAGSAPVTVIEETWDAAWASRWITFGDPHPVVTSGPGGIRALWSRGDGTYPSQAILRRAFRARQGLGLEVRLSTPATRDEGQRARAYLVAGIDTAAFRDADQRMSPPSMGSPEAICGAGYPGSSGRLGRGLLAGYAGRTTSISLGEAGGLLSSGQWWTLRVQILPDGRCGIAANGRVLWLSPAPIPLEGDFRVRLGDESAGTRLLHGPLQVWTGVRSDIDWSAP